jgi:hypothetical protein
MTTLLFTTNLPIPMMRRNTTNPKENLKTKNVNK